MKAATDRPSPHMPAREEWDFRDVADDELFPCQWWEYARESARIRAYYRPEDSDFFPSPGMQLEIRRDDGTITHETRRRVVNPVRMRFSATLREYALPLVETAGRAWKAEIKNDALNLPWQCLPETVRRGVVEDLQPFFTKMPWLTFLPFNRCSDLRDLGIADEDYRCAQFDEETGIERFRVQIDWAGFTDSQIVEAFRIWVKENRPPDVGRANDRGVRKGPGLEAQLKSLGILRLMHACPLSRIKKEWPEAWKRYRTMDWPRARQNAGRTFRELLFFLPDDDRPLHWPTAGGRAK